MSTPRELKLENELKLANKLNDKLRRQNKLKYDSYEKQMGLLRDEIKELEEKIESALVQVRKEMKFFKSGSDIRKGRENALEWVLKLLK